jgi:SAM-dependent methyltransferase
MLSSKNCYCGSKLKKKIKFKDLPLINKYYKTKYFKKFPLKLSLCSRCYTIQILDKIKDKSLYPKNYQYLSSSSKEKLLHYRNYHKVIKNLKKNSKKILEIGSNDNILLNELSKKYDVCGIEPTNNSKINKTKKFKIYNFFLNEKNVLKIKDKFDIILILNLIGSTNNPLKLLQTCKKLIKDDGIIILEFQNIENIIKSKNIDSFHHEHNYYFSNYTIRNLVRYSNFKIIKLQNLKLHGGIKRVILKKNNKFKTQKISNIKSIKKNEIKNFNKIKLLKAKCILKYNNLFKVINSLKNSGYQIQGIGAAPRAVSTIINSNLKKKLVPYIGETNKKKIGFFFPGTDIKILSENNILKKNPNFLIIFNWHLTDRIIKTLKSKKYKNYFITIKDKIKIVK